jgi:hypothetical protein
MRRWRITCDADAVVRDLASVRPPRGTRLALDLTFEALTPAVGTDGQGRSASGVSAETSATVGKGHLEQAGRIQGWIAADGRRHDIALARGNRDKSWGPRRWGGPRMWRWFSINVGDHLHLGGIRIGTGAGDLHRGWVWRDGEATSIRRWDLRTTLAPDGVTHRTVEVRAADARGRVHVLEGEVLRVAPVAHEVGGRRTVINEGLARFVCDGGTGYGIAEYLHQLDAEGRPAVPIE